MAPMVTCDLPINCRRGLLRDLQIPNSWNESDENTNDHCPFLLFAEYVALLFKKLRYTRQSRHFILQTDQYEKIDFITNIWMA